MIIIVKSSHPSRERGEYSPVEQISAKLLARKAEFVPVPKLHNIHVAFAISPAKWSMITGGLCRRGFPSKNLFVIPQKIRLLGVRIW